MLSVLLVHRYSVTCFPHTDFPFWNIENTVCASCVRLFMAAKNFMFVHFGLCLQLLQPPPSLHSSTEGSQCVIKHVSSRVTVRDDRPLASPVTCSTRIGSKAWHHRAKRPVSPTVIVLPFGLPLPVPIASAAAVLALVWISCVCFEMDGDHMLVHPPQ